MASDGGGSRSARTRRLGRLAGLAYAALFVSGSFPLFVQARLVPGRGVETTIERLAEGAMLLRLAVVSELVMALAWTAVAFLLYLLFEPEGPLAKLFLLLAGIGVATVCSHLVLQVAVLDLAVAEGSLKAFELGFREDHVELFRRLFSRGWTIASVFTGLWLAPLGVLVLRTGVFPRPFAYLLLLACVAYLVTVSTVFLFPGAARWNLSILSVAGFGEISFGLWLMFGRPPVASTIRRSTPR